MNFKKGFATVLAGIIVSLSSANAAREPVSPGANVPPVYPAGSRALQQAASAASDASDSEEAPNGNPYALIISRNVFHLNPPPPPVVAPTPQVPVGTLKFTGFIKSGDDPVRGLFVNIAKEATNTAYYNLKEGERQGDLEVLKLHEDVEAAEVMHFGNRLTLWLTNSRPASVTTPAAPAPGAPGAPGTPGIAPAPVPQQLTQLGNPNRGVTVAGAVPPPAPGAIPVAPTTAIPTRNIRATPPQQAAPQTAAESVRRMQIDAANHEQEINSGLYPPPPPPPPGMNFE